jgi:hypothetical protein
MVGPRSLCVVPCGGPNWASCACSNACSSGRGSWTPPVFFIVIAHARGLEAAAHGVKDGVLFTEERAEEDDNKADRLDAHPEGRRKKDRAAELHEGVVILRDAAVGRRILVAGH